MAEEVSRVAQQCEEAKQSQILDLSHCELMSVPDAVFFILKNVTLTEVNLSHNSLKKLPNKLSTKFSTITSLDLSHNKLTLLPENLNQLVNCVSLNLSHNQFTQLPDVLLTMPLLETLDFGHNLVASVDTDRLSLSPSLQTIILTGNPLDDDCKSILESIVRVKIVL